MIEINEPGISLRFPENDCFVIEDDPIIRGTQCVKPCECVATVNVKGKSHTLFLEAKSSAPQEKLCRRDLMEYDGNPLPEKWEIITDFDIFVNEICQKFEDSFSTFYAVSRGHHGNEAFKRLPAGCNSLDTTRILFILVISGFKEEWLAPLNDAIKRRLRHFLNSWNIRDTSVKTLTLQGAKAFGLPVV